MDFGLPKAFKNPLKIDSKSAKIVSELKKPPKSRPRGLKTLPHASERRRKGRLRRSKEPPGGLKTPSETLPRHLFKQSLRDVMNELTLHSQSNKFVAE